MSFSLFHSYYKLEVVMPCSCITELSGLESNNPFSYIQHYLVLFVTRSSEYTLVCRLIYDLTICIKESDTIQCRIRRPVEEMNLPDSASNFSVC